MRTDAQLSGPPLPIDVTGCVAPSDPMTKSPVSISDAFLNPSSVSTSERAGNVNECFDILFVLLE